MPFGGSWIPPGTSYIWCVPHSRHLKHLSDGWWNEWTDWTSSNQHWKEFEGVTTQTYLWGCGELLPLDNIPSSLFLLGTWKGHACSTELRYGYASHEMWLRWLMSLPGGGWCRITDAAFPLQQPLRNHELNQQLALLSQQEDPALENCLDAKQTCTSKK